jgi:VWFA-related protein
MRAFASRAIVGLAAASVVAGQQPPAPTLRASVEQVVVDVVVTDAAGAPVSGLSAADFEIREDGRPQAILTFSEVALPLTPRAPGTPPPRPPDVRSNRQAGEGRVYLLFVDDQFVMPARTFGVRALAREFLDRYLQPGDLVAVATSSGLGGGAQAFTDDPALAARAIDRVVGRKSRSATIEKLEAAYRAREMDPLRTRRAGGANNTFNRDGAVLGVNAIDDELLDRARVSLRTIRGLVQAMADVPGHRKTLIYVSEGIDIPLTPGDTTEVARELDAILAAAARANVAIYPISPRGLSGLGDEMMEVRALPTDQTGPIAPGSLTDIAREQRTAAAMLRAVADGTGGTAAVDMTQVRQALGRIAEESSRYYLLGYTSPNTKRDGRYRPIAVRVTRPGLQVTARKGYTAPDDTAPPPEPFKGLTPELGALLRRPLPTPGLPVTAHAVAFPSGTDNVSVTIELPPGAVAFAERGDKRVSAVDVAILPVDAAGRTHGLTQGHPTLTLDPAMADTVAGKGLRLSHRLSLGPGDYQLRIAVREAGRRALGSVLCDLHVPDLTTPGLVMTPIVVSSAKAIEVPSAYNDPGLLRALGGPPTTARAFATADTLSAYVELRDVGVTAARGVDLLTTVRDGRGRDVVRSPQPKADGRVGPGESFAYAVDLPLQALAPGRYTLRIEARAAGLAEPLARELTFEVRTP